MKEVILIKTGEIALKGLNKNTFEDMLMKNIKRRLQADGKFRLYKAQSTFYIEPSDEFNFDSAIEKIGKIFGIAAYARAAVTDKDMVKILSKAQEYLSSTLSDVKTFKVEAKRADKQFPLTSPEIASQTGAALLEANPHLKVDVHNPDITVLVEIRDFAAYIHAGSLPGAGGMPVGSSGKATLLLSGGIDSPVAGIMMAKRGLSLMAVHFVSPPYTSERAKQKVITLCEKMSAYAGRIEFYCVPFTQLQEAIRDNCKPELFTVILRRMMFKVAQRLSMEHGSAALITGESLAQVASQTLPAIQCTDAVCELPVLRPVIGMDKEEIVRFARKTDTFETSILPYEDCCTVFTPKHPKTRPNIAELEEEESKFDFESLLNRAKENCEILTIG